MRRLCILLWLGSANVIAGPYEDCILQNVKGIQVPQAIAEVRKACAQKYEEDKRSRVMAFGDRLAWDSFKGSPTWEIESKGQHAMRFTNTNIDRTVTYARLLVAPAAEDGKSCDRNKARGYVYTMSVRPSQTVRLIYPSVETRSECVYISGLLGRPPSWTDIWSAPSVSPLSNDPLADID
jgi:hypothetical protein